MRSKFSIQDIVAMSYQDLNTLKSEYRLYTKRRERTPLKSATSALLIKREKALKILCRAKKRALSKEADFDLDVEWVMSKIEQGKCEVTDIPFSESKTFVASIDRIDSSLGYTKANCQMVVWIYNRAKNEDSLAEVITLSRAILAKYD